MNRQSQLAPQDNKFHQGNSSDGKHYWLTPPDLYASLDREFHFDFDPCPHPLPDGFDGLTCEWGQSNYVNPPFGAIIHEGKKKGATAWVRKAIKEWKKGKRIVFVYPFKKWELMLFECIGTNIRNLGDVRWLSIEDGSPGRGSGWHTACFILEPGNQEQILNLVGAGTNGSQGAASDLSLRLTNRRQIEPVFLKTDPKLVHVGYREFNGNPRGLSPIYIKDCRRGEERRK